MRLDPEASAITLQVEVQGERASRAITMVLDTGATYVVIPWDIAEALGYDPVASQRTVDLATASSVEIAPLLTVRRVRALGVEAFDVDVLCYNLPAASGVQGLLGLSFLKHFDVDLHFRRQVLEARDP